MQSTSPAIPVSKGALWTGRIFSALIVLFLLMDSIMKFVSPKPAPVVDAFTHLGWPIDSAFALSCILLISTILYAIPSTSVLGAILLTGYLGGAVATHMRIGNPLFSHILFPVYVGILLWGGLFLRDPRLKALIPFRSK